MKVCMITYSLYESDSRVMRYAEALSARGDEVEVIALRKDGTLKEEVMRGVRVLRVQRRDFKEKTKTSFLKGVALFSLRAAWTATKRHLKNRYDLLHVHSIPDFVVFAALIPKLLGGKVILDIHDILPELYESKFGVSKQSLEFRAMVLLERISTAFADHVIIANHIWRDRLLSRCLAPSKCTVLLNYPDRSIFRPMPRHRDSKEFVLLYPGTLNQHQGLDVAIRAFAIVLERVPNAAFHIHGEGRTEHLLRRLVERLGLQQRVLFKPVLPIHEIARVMANADLAIVPKKNDSFGNEAFSTKILEFMSVGVPVIVSTTKIDQYYFNESVVTFFKGGDEQELAKSILLLIRDRERREQMVKNASEFVRAFDWQSNKEKYLGLVDSVFRGNGKPEESASLHKTTSGGVA